MKIAVFWVVAPCSLVEVYQRFRGPCCLHHQGVALLQPRRQQSSNRTCVKNGLSDFSIILYFPVYFDGSVPPSPWPGCGSSLLPLDPLHSLPSPQSSPLTIGPAKLLPCPTCSYISTHFFTRVYSPPDDGGSKRY
jgi:hypothetical protein